MESGKKKRIFFLWFLKYMFACVEIVDCTLQSYMPQFYSVVTEIAVFAIVNFLSRCLLYSLVLFK
jgi:hypothetical protein